MRLSCLFWKHLSPKTIAALDCLENISDRACVLLHGHVAQSVMCVCGGSRPSKSSTLAALSEIAGSFIARTWARRGDDLVQVLRGNYQKLVKLLVEMIVELVMEESGACGDERAANASDDQHVHRDEEGQSDSASSDVPWHCFMEVNDVQQISAVSRLHQSLARNLTT